MNWISFGFLVVLKFMVLFVDIDKKVQEKILQVILGIAFTFYIVSFIISVVLFFHSYKMDGMVEKYE